jgi:hypothetical protein
MNTLPDFLNSLGGLHDATVVSVEWQVESKVLEFRFDDLYANFRDMDEYPGRRKGLIRLLGVSEVLIDIESDEQPRVFEFLPDEQQPDMVVLRLSPAGRVTAKYLTAEHPPRELPR